MPLPKMQDFSFNHAEQTDALYTVMTGQQIKEAFDSRGLELKNFLDQTVDKLNSTIEGQSGADYIGAGPVEGLVGNTIMALLRALKVAIDSVQSGELNASSIPLSALKTDVATQQELDAAIQGWEQLLTNHANVAATDVRYGHITIGANADQAAPGTHKHDGTYEPVLPVERKRKETFSTTVPTAAELEEYEIRYVHEA
jgi:hypothetical protein